jgi:hypothetical protein
MGFMKLVTQSTQFLSKFSLCLKKNCAGEQWENGMLLLIDMGPGAMEVSSTSNRRMHDSCE